MTSRDSSEQRTPSATSNGTSVNAIITCNSISIFVCFVTLSLYTTLSLKKKYKRLMRRTSLALAACMASSDLILHCSTLAGYGNLPEGFACAFVGGWLFAAPTMLSIFYSCCIALNSQIAFVFKRRSPSHALAYFIVVPIMITFLIAFCALGTGSYGFDETWGYCWYATQGVLASTVLIRMIFTYSLPTLLCMLYLFIATITISLAVFGAPSAPTMPMRSRTNDVPPNLHTFPPSSPRDQKPQPPSPRPIMQPSKRSRSSETQPSAHLRVERVHSGASRKALVMRQLTVRLIGYIVAPILCLLPGIILDLITKVFPDMEVPTALNALFDGLNGLVGLFNSLLMLSDPALLAVWEDLRTSVAKSSNGPGEAFLRRVLGYRGDDHLPSSSSNSQSVFGYGRRGRADVDDDVLASGFGVGARTRIDHLEEGEMVDEVKEEKAYNRGTENVTQHISRAIRETDESGQQLAAKHPIQHDGQTQSTTTPYNLRTTADPGPGDAGRHGLSEVQPRLEVHVRVDVTRRMSRVQLMEDWLSGL